MLWKMVSGMRLECYIDQPNLLGEESRFRLSYGSSSEMKSCKGMQNPAQRHENRYLREERVSCALSEIFPSIRFFNLWMAVVLPKNCSSKSPFSCAFCFVSARAGSCCFASDNSTPSSSFFPFESFSTSLQHSLSFSCTASSPSFVSRFYTTLFSSLCFCKCAVSTSDPISGSCMTTFRRPHKDHPRPFFVVVLTGRRHSFSCLQ